jgi:Ig-like domain CHU_C associated
VRIPLHFSTPNRWPALLAGLLSLLLTHQAIAQCTATITTSGPTTFCQGGSVTLSVPAVAGSTYQWSSTQNTPSITVTQSGSYSVTVTTSGGCTATSAPVTVTVNPTPVVLTTTSGARCGAGTVVLEAHNVPPGGTRWYDVATGGTPIAVSVNPFTTPTLTSTTTFYVSGVNAAGCEGPRAPVTATINPLPNATITASGPTTFCQGGSVVLTAAGGIGYQWSTGATTSSITVTQAGTYSVTATNAAGCSATSAATTVTISSAGSAAFAYPTSTYCLNGSNPTPAITGTAGGTFSASPAGLSLNPSTGQINLAASTAGTYTITYSVTGSCAAQQTQTVTLTTAPAALFGYNNGGSLCAGAGGSVLPTLVPGSSIGTMTATPAGLSLNPATGAIDLSQSQPGTYTVTNTIPASGNCAAASFTRSVTVVAAPTATITASGPTTFCQGSSVVLTAMNGSSYQWSTGATTPSITVTQAGTYSVTVTYAAGCTSTSAPTVVTVNPAQLALTVTGASRCGPGSVPLEAHNIPPGGTRWYDVASGGTPVAVSVNPLITPTLTATTTYYVSGVNAAGCEGPRTAVTGTINPLPNASVAASGLTTFCQGGSVTLTASGGGTYLWSTGATTPSITVSTSGSYSVTVTNATGCAATPAATTVTVTPRASAAFAYPTSTYCSNAPTNPLPTITGATGGTFSVSPAGLNLDPSTGQINLAASAAGTYAVTYSVTGQCPDQRTVTMTVTAAPAAQFSYGGVICAGATSLVLPTLGAGSSIGTVTHTPAGLGLDAATGAINPSQSLPGTYTVTNTIPASGICAPVSATTTVTVQAAPTAAIAAGGATTFCQGGSVTLTASGGTSYQWSTGATTPSITVTQAGAYSVTATNAAGCSATSSPVTVQVNPQASAAFTYPTSTNSYCLSAASNPVPIISGTPGGLFITTPAGISQNSTTGEINLANSVAGTYTITYTVTGPCPAQQTATLTLFAAPVAQFSYAAVSYCATTGTVSPTLGTGAVAGTFAATPAGLSLNPSTGAIDVSQSQPGTYTVTNSVAGAGPCPTTTATTTVTMLAAPSATVAANGPTAFCQGGSVTLSAPAGANLYQWSTGATTASITVSTSGSYSVTVSNAGGCVATSAAVAVIVNPLPAAPAITQQTQGGGVLLTSSAFTGNQWYFNGAPIAGATGTTYLATQSGSYTVVTISGAGCASAPSAPVSVIITGLAADRARSGMSLFPNPASREAYLTLATPAPAGSTVRLVDAVGRLVRMIPLASGATSAGISLTGVPAGIYLVQYSATTVRLVVE